MDGYKEVSLTITKASLQDDGTMRWQAVASDTDTDRTGERTSLALFQDWIERATTGKGVAFLSPPRRPFLGVSHYPDLNGFGEAGATEKMYVDGNRFKAAGVFYSGAEHPLGKALFEAVRNEHELIQRGETLSQPPIRISAAWWDLAHSHGSFIFERKSLDDACPMCAKGAGDKAYLKGQLDHFAATRVPINPRTALALEEKSMTTRKQDAESIIGDIDDELPEELERRARLVGKSEADEKQPEGLVVKADKESMMEDCPEDDEECKKRRKKMMEDKAEVQEFSRALDDIAIRAIRARAPEVEKMGEMASEEEHRPYGGAMSMKEADDWIAAQERVSQAYSNWGTLNMVMENVLAYADPGEMKAKIQNVMSEFSDRIGQLKAAVEDAYLVQPIEEDYEMATEQPTGIDKAFGMLTDALGASGTREERLAKAQEAFNALAEVVKAEIDVVTPPDPSAEVNKAILEKLDLIAARLTGPAQLAAVPQQKSFAPAGPVQSQAQPELPISPMTGKPSSLRAMIERSVGMH